MILNLFLGDKFGNMVPIYTFYENLYKLSEKNNKDNKITNVIISTNKQKIKIFKIYINVNFSFLVQLSQNPIIKQLNIICMGEVYNILSGKDKNIAIEPDKTKKMNIFHLFNFMPYTSASIETLLVLMSKDFIDYRIKYIHTNVPLINLNTNKHSNFLNDLLHNYYYITLYSPSLNFKTQKKYLLVLNYLNYLEKIKDFTLPKLTNLNLIKKNNNLSTEDFIFKSIKIKKMEFLTSSYDGILIINKIKFLDAENDNINNELNMIINLITAKDDSICSFQLYKLIIKKYKKYIDYLDIKEIYIGTKIDIFNNYFKNKDNFYRFNFLLELSKNNIYRIIINQMINIELQKIMINNNINIYGIMLSKQLGYLDLDSIRKNLGDENQDERWESFHNDDFQFIIPPELT